MNCSILFQPSTLFPIRWSTAAWIEVRGCHGEKWGLPLPPLLCSRKHYVRWQCFRVTRIHAAFTAERSRMLLMLWSSFSGETPPRAPANNKDRAARSGRLAKQMAPSGQNMSVNAREYSWHACLFNGGRGFRGGEGAFVWLRANVRHRLCQRMTRVTSGMVPVLFIDLPEPLVRLRWACRSVVGRSELCGFCQCWHKD